MANFITDHFCEPVTIGPPNIITKDCLPEGEELVCLYTIDLNVPLTYDYYTDAYTYPYDWYNGLDIVYDEDYYYAYIAASGVTYDLHKMVKVDEDTGIQQEFWLAETTGSDGDDVISGYGMLQYIDYEADYGVGSVAQVDPSVYLGDLIHFSIDGGAGDDWIEGANNADILKGGLGNDEIYGLDGDDEIYGNEGDDYVYGGYGWDEIDGGEGNDDLYGDDGHDNLTGGAGNDYLDGGNGNDWMSGGEDDDDIYGGDGDDNADGGAGNDYISMDAGNDRAVGGEGDDDIYGGYGDDKLDGQAGNDYVYGDYGNDLVDGGDGDDYVYGGAGDDIVRGGLGEDKLWGNEGCDVFVFCEVSLNCNDAVMDFETGFDGDQIDLTELDIDKVRVEGTGKDNIVRLDLIDDGDLVQTIVVQAAQSTTDLYSVFETDTAYASDMGAMVRVGDGVMVDLPSLSVLEVSDGMFV